MISATLFFALIYFGTGVTAVLNLLVHDTHRQYPIFQNIIAQHPTYLSKCAAVHMVTTMTLDIIFWPRLFLNAYRGSVLRKFNKIYGVYINESEYSPQYV